MINRVWVAIRKLSASIGGLACIMLGVCIVAQVFTRTFLGVALTWSEELAEVGMILMVFLTLAEVEAGNEHLQVEILHTLLPKLSFGMTVIGKILTLAYSAIVVYSGTLMLPSVRRAVAKASGFPVRILYYAIIVGTLLWFIQAAINLVKTIKERKGFAS